MSADHAPHLLASLFRPKSGPNAAVAHDSEGGSVSAASLFARAAAIAVHLPDATPGSEVAFSFGSDQVGFAAALLATWSRGHTAALPEDEHRDNIVPLLEREENAGFLHDTGVGLGIHVPSLLEARLVEGTELPWTVPFEDDRAALIAFRQAAIGEARSWSSTPTELAGRIELLAESLDLVPKARMASSFSPSSVPGLLVGILAPLRRGGTFAARTVRPEEPAFHEPRGAAEMWVGSPAHARTLARCKDPRPELEALFIADGGVDAAAASQLIARSKVRVVPLTDLPLEDEYDAQALKLEAALHADPTTKDAAVATIDVDGEPKTFVAIEVEEAAELAPLRQRIEEHLPAGATWELKAFPSLPRNENGRLPAWRTALAFGVGRHGHTLETQLSWTRAVEETDEAYRFRARLPEHYAFFEGHYTGYPILAGAVQIHELVLPCLREIAPDAGAITRLTGLKFMSRIAPGDEVEVILRKSSPSDYRFDIESAGTRCSAGQIRFTVPEEESR